MRFNRVHAICQELRNGINCKHTTKCKRCPIREKTPYGWGVRGCVWRAQEIINIAKIGWPWSKPPKGKRGKQWRKTVFTGGGRVEKRS